MDIVFYGLSLISTAMLFPGSSLMAQTCLAHCVIYICMQMLAILAHYSWFATRKTISAHQSLDNLDLQKMNARPIQQLDFTTFSIEVIK